MSLEQGEKTLGINNWKFNQDGFKDGVCDVRARVCVCMHVSDRNALRLVQGTLVG